METIYQHEIEQYRKDSNRVLAICREHRWQRIRSHLSAILDILFPVSSGSVVVMVALAASASIYA